MTLLALAPAAAVAQSNPILLVVEPELDLDADILREGLARDLERAVVVEGDAPSRLEVRAVDGRVVLRYEEGDSARERRVELPDDPAEATATVLLIASNLVRDPTLELIAPESDGSPDAEEPSPSFAVRHPFRLNFGALVGAASTPVGTRGYWHLGMDLVGTVHPNLAVGVTRISLGFGASSIDGFIFSLQGTPTLELFGFVDPHVQVFAQLGVALQGRAQTASREGFVQVAPYLGGGTRIFPNDWFSIGVEIGLHLIATDSFLMGDVALPQGSLAGSAGLSANWHF